MLKKIIVGLAASVVAVAVSVLPVGKQLNIFDNEVMVYADTTYTSGFWSYVKYDDGTIGISGYSGLDAELTIPSELDGYKVTAIDNGAFEYSKAIQKVTIPNTVNTIGYHAFAYSSLTEISIPESVTTWNMDAEEYNEDYIFYEKDVNCAFAECDNLIYVTINSKVVPEGCFYSCDALTAVICGENTQSIGSHAFARATSLVRVTFGTAMKDIGTCAFYGDTNLETVEVKSNITTIANYAFENCESLSHISLGTELTTIGCAAFCNSGLIEITIPESVTNWNYDRDKKSHAFVDCDDLKRVVIKSKIVPVRGFESCNTLERVELGELTETVGEGAFCYCDSLTDVVLGTNTHTIGAYAFSNNVNLERIEVKSNLEYIYDSAFINCKKLTNIDLGNRLLHIGSHVFQNSGLMELTIPDSVRKWNLNYDEYDEDDRYYMGEESRAFAECSNLKIARIGSTILPERAFHKSRNVNIHCMEGSSAHKYAVENGISYTLEKAISATDMKLHASAFTMLKGTTMQLYPVLKPQNTTDKITWLSGDTSIAEISENGKVTAKKAGLVAIKGTTTSGKTCSATITVVETGTAVEDVIEQKDITLSTVEGIKTFKLGDTEFGEKVYFNFFTKLIRNLDYTISCVADTETSGAKIVIQGIGEYTGTITIEIQSIENFTVNGVSEQPYTGDAITLPIELFSASGEKLVLDTDYIVSYVQNTDVGTAIVILEGIGNYTGIIKKEFKINPSNNFEVELETIEYVYDGIEKKPKSIVKSGEKILVEGIDYVVNYVENVNVGTASVLVTGINNYTGTVEKVFEIQQKSFYDSAIPTGAKKYNSHYYYLYKICDDEGVIFDPNFTWTKAKNECEKLGGHLVTINSAEEQSMLEEWLPEDGLNMFCIGATAKQGNWKWITNEDMIYENILDEDWLGVTTNISYVDDGGCRMVYAPQYGWNWTWGGINDSQEDINGYICEWESDILKESNSLEIVLDKELYTYDGNEKKPSVTIKFDDTILKYGTDYLIEYSNNVKIGTATVTVTGIGNYNGIITRNYIIQPVELSEVLLSSYTYEYDGTEKRPKVTVKSGNNELIENIDYSITYVENIDVGMASVVVVGEGIYTGTITKTFTINKSNLTEVLLCEDVYMYDGKEKKPNVNVKSKDSVLVAGVDYKVEYVSNVSAGIAKIIVSGIENYTGIIVKTFVIQPTNLSSVSLATKSYSYNGTAKKPSVTVKSGTKKLILGTDYFVSYSNNINPGVATVTVTGIGNYTGTVNKTFTIKLPKVQKLKQSTTYSSTKITMTWNKVSGATGYAIYRSNTKNGSYKYLKSVTANTLTLQGLKAGNKFYYKICAYKTVNGKKIYGEYSDAKSMFTRTAAPKISVVLKSKTAKISWAKVTGAQGYEIYMSTSKSGTYKKIKAVGSTTLSSSKTGLAKGKKYYFKMRSYTKTGTGVKVYSGYSDVKSVTVK